MYIPLELTPLFNVFLIIILVLFILTGYRKGVLLQILDFFGLLVALFIAWMFSPACGAVFNVIPKEFTPFQNTILASLFYKQINSVVWFIILFLAVSLLVFLLKPIVKTVGKIPVLKQLNSVFGIVFSILKLLTTSAIIIFVLSTPLFKNGGEIVERTWLKHMRSITTSVMGFIEKPLIENQAMQTIITNPKQASKEDLEAIVRWLKESGVDDKTISQFLGEIEK